MAQVSGFVCDKCATFETASRPGTAPPPGWVTVTPHVKLVSNGDDGQHVDKSFQVCGNRCLAELGVERYEEETGKRLVRTPRSTPAARKPRAKKGETK